MLKTRWMAEREAKDCQLKSPHAHVVIATPGSGGIVLRCDGASLRLFFHDLEPAKIKATKAFEKMPDKGKQMIDECFTLKQALQIVDFVKAADGGEVIVNCEAGVSRSPAVVLALRRHFGGDTQEVFTRAYLNPHVVKLMEQALKAKYA